MSVGAWACSGQSELLEISSQEAALTATENSERALAGLIDAADFLVASTSIAETLSAFGTTETCSTSGVSCTGLDCPEPQTVCTREEIDAEQLEETRQKLRDGARELVEQLRERVLIPANLEAETSTSASYRLGADVLCSDEAESGSEEPDADCVEQVTRLEPRLVLTSPREGDIDITLQLGAERHEPLTLALHQKSLGVRLDLGEALALARDLDTEGELSSLDALSGVLELRLVENAARDYSLELDVSEAIEAVVDSDGASLSASLGASSPAWNVRVDGNSQTLSAGIDLAALRVMGPLRAFAGLFAESADDTEDAEDGGLGLGPEQEPPAYRGVLELFLAGLSGTLSYTADSDVLELDDLGFGDATSSLRHDDRTLLALDLNAAAGRRVNLRLSPSDTGTQISVTPSFDLRLALAFHYVADQFEELSSYLLDDTLRVWLEGDAPALHVSDAGLRVSSGTLHVESRANAEANVTVAAGMCLGESDAAEGEDTEEGALPAHPLASLEATTCE